MTTKRSVFDQNEDFEKWYHVKPPTTKVECRPVTSQTLLIGYEMGRS